jgi:SulP family sulfate permease
MPAKRPSFRTVVSQLVYSLGGSSFPCATASMIIEVIPFFHIMAADIVSMLGEENSHQIIATVMVAFALSSILTGM